MYTGTENRPEMILSYEPSRMHDIKIRNRTFRKKNFHIGTIRFNDNLGIIYLENWMVGTYRILGTYHRILEATAVEMIFMIYPGRSTKLSRFGLHVYNLTKLFKTMRSFSRTLSTKQKEERQFEVNCANANRKYGDKAWSKHELAYCARNKEHRKNQILAC